eukprot:scaffold7052_cov254-Pinguiococcus_pyrenoidosus.AAC.15
MWTPPSCHSGYSSQEDSVPSVPSVDSSPATSAGPTGSRRRAPGAGQSLIRVQKRGRQWGNSRRASSAPPRGKFLGRRRRAAAAPRPFSLQSGRVKVGLRCRPPFRDEMPANRPFQPVVRVVPREATAQKEVAQVHVALQPTQRQRVFYFDYGFGPRATQTEVYETLARPVVQRMLQGYNGTIFAYGQTGTGKTHTMGILETVTEESAGIVPRALKDVFAFADRASHGPVGITVSFLQIYRETIQDLLASGASSPRSAAAHGPTNANLCIRESTDKGFYVEGLSEFVVRTYEEAEAIVNLGLQYRALAATALNTTSSRSHTILTVTVEQRPAALEIDAAVSVQGKLRSKLLLIDLAGSERVRRAGRGRVAGSKQERLHETKSINSSLSALGNVIAALSSHDCAHIPYRNSKLTRLLQDSLGGTASTALIACVGPAQCCQQETLSTLLFASRCMQVSSTPVKNEEIDYAHLCANLQARLASLQQSHQSQLQRQKLQYEHVITKLKQHPGALMTPDQKLHAAILCGLGRVEALAKRTEEGGADALQSLEHWAPDRLARLSQHLFEAFNAIGNEMHQSYREGLEAQRRLQLELQEATQRVEARGPQRCWGGNGSRSRDPSAATNPSRQPDLAKAIEAWRAAERRHSAQSCKLPKLEALFARVKGRAPVDGEADFPVIQDFASASQLVEYVDDLVVAANRWHAQIEHHHLHSLEALDALRQELTAEVEDRRRSEEEATNLSQALKWLLRKNQKVGQGLSTEDESTGATGADGLSELPASSRLLLENILASVHADSPAHRVEPAEDPARAAASFSGLALRRGKGTRVITKSDADGQDLEQGHTQGASSNDDEEDDEEDDEQQDLSDTPMPVEATAASAGGNHRQALCEHQPHLPRSPGKSSGQKLSARPREATRTSWATKAATANSPGTKPQQSEHSFELTPERYGGVLVRETKRDKERQRGSAWFPHRSTDHLLTITNSSASESDDLSYGSSLSKGQQRSSTGDMDMRKGLQKVEKLAGLPNKRSSAASLKAVVKDGLGLGPSVKGKGGQAAKRAKDPWAASYSYSSDSIGSSLFDDGERWANLDAETKKIMRKVKMLKLEEIQSLPPSTRDAVLILRKKLGLATR